MLMKLHLRRSKQFDAGYRRRQKEGSKGFFWRLQSLSFRSTALIFMAVAAIGVYAAWGPVLHQRFDRYYDYFHDKFLPTFANATTVSATASSHLSKGTRPKDAIDDHFNTSWVSKSTRSHGVSQTITVHFDEAVKFGLVGFRSGLQTKKGDLVPAVTRPKKVRIFYYNGKGGLIKGKSSVCNLDDKASFQKCGSVNLPAVKTIKVRVLEVYGKIGKKQPVGIAEVEPRKRK